jgi:GT2 family glycosyltransferase/glycosyltransferase involved in cell wall biosynthesis
MKISLLRFLRALPLLILTPLLLATAAFALALADLAWLIAGRRRKRASAEFDIKPDTRAASLVIPNWNGKDLLQRFLPTWSAAIANHPGSEIIVVDNASSDGSAAWLATNYRDVRVVELAENLGFGGGSNAGIRAAMNDVVVLLNNDMRVEPDFLAPLLAGFADETVFAVSSQIFLADKTKRREETGLTQGWWQDGGLRVGHREDPLVDVIFPCFYGGGGSCAFDRRKFLELGGFDELLKPFYLEDTDLGYMAWKRGWKVLYQPASVVHHEHRGTIGKRFSGGYIEAVLQKNFMLFCWKNIHGWGRLSQHFSFSFAGAVMTAWSGNVPGRASVRGILKAFVQLPRAVSSRWIARNLAVVDDSEAFRRAQPAYFHDRFSSLVPNPERPKILFVSPYPICPPIHGGGLFMYYTLRELSRYCEVHAIVMLDEASQYEPNQELRRYCKTVEFYLRTADRNPHLASITSHAVHEFQRPEIEWLIQRQTLLHRIDVIQLEYTALGQYAHRFKRLVCALFEHDVYFQSVGRSLEFIRSPVDRLKAGFEYLRALRYELKLLPRCDQIQVCTEENKRYLESFLPGLAPRIGAGLRAGIDTSLYPFLGGPRKPHTMLFLGSFRHLPNKVALDWFTRHVLPLIVAEAPEARLLVAGSDPPPRHTFADPAKAIELLGFVDDVQPLLSSCAVFVCPIRSGSGVRVKLLEAFGSGIPVVSTRLGAEGLARKDGEFCALADDPEAFAAKVLDLLEHPGRAAEMAVRARQHVETHWDMAVITRRLVDKYREMLYQKRLRGTGGAAEAISCSGWTRKSNSPTSSDGSGASAAVLP